MIEREKFMKLFFYCNLIYFGFLQKKEAFHQFAGFEFQNVDYIHHVHGIKLVDIEIRVVPHTENCLQYPFHLFHN